jgi:nitroimidazol reductase NimA-like FMN-containing flavoprotein (pyridoxamine 5'-phosphate oxidase superfamily)
MPKLTSEETEQMLSRGRGILRLGTIRPDGAPVVVPLRFTYRDRTVYLTARARAKWLEDIRRDPRVCVSIDDTDYERKKVTIRSKARVVYEPGEDDKWRDLRLPLRRSSWTGPTRLATGEEEWIFDEAYTEMTWNEPRALVGIALDDSKVTTWRLPRVGEYVHEAWSGGYFEGEAPRRFRVSQLGSNPDEPDDWRVIAEP